MHRQRDLVLHSSRLPASGIHLSPRNVIASPDFQQLGERLDQTRSTGGQVHSALVEDQGSRRNETGSSHAEASGRNLDELSIGNVHESAVIAYHWEVRAPGSVLGILLFVYGRLHDANQVIVLQRKFARFVECNAARSRRVILLPQDSAVAEAQQDRNERNADFHDLSLCVVAFNPPRSPKFSGVFRSMAISSRMATQTQAMR